MFLEDWYVNVHSSIIHNKKDEDSFKVLHIMSEWKIQYIYAMKLQKNNPKACYNMREPQKHFAKWKKLNKNVYILYDSTYVKCSEKTSLSRYRNIEILKNNWFFFWLEFWRRKWLHMELWEFIGLWKCSKNELPEKIFLCDLVILICKGSFADSGYVPCLPEKIMYSTVLQ